MRKKINENLLTRNLTGRGQITERELHEFNDLEHRIIELMGEDYCEGDDLIMELGVETV